MSLTNDDLLAIAVIGGTMTHEGVLPPSVLAVQPEHFCDARYASVWNAVLMQLEDRRPVDSTSIIHRMVTEGAKSGDVVPLVCGLEADCPTSANLDHWAKQLVEDGTRRLLGDQLASVSSERLTSEELAERVSSIMRSSVKPTSAGLVPMRTGLGMLLKELEAERNDPDGTRFIGSGIKTLDAVLKLERGQLSIIAGRPSMGKSALAGNIAAFCARSGDKGITAMFSLEMSTTALVRRMVAAEMGANTAELSKRVGDNALAEAMERLHELSLYIDDRSGLSVSDMRRALLSAKGKVRLVLVDYLQLTRLDSDRERHDLKVGAVTKELKTLAKEFDCHVIALCQLNRQVEARVPSVPQLSDMRDSGNIEEDADNVIMLYRPSYYGQQYKGRDASPEEAVILVTKQRNGATCQVDVGWNSKYQAFYDFPRVT